MITIKSIYQKYCMDMNYLHAKKILSGEEKGNAKKAQEAVNQHESGFLVTFFSKNGSPLQYRVKDAKNEKAAISMAVVEAKKRNFWKSIDPKKTVVKFYKNRLDMPM